MTFAFLGGGVWDLIYLSKKKSASDKRQRAHVEALRGGDGWSQVELNRSLKQRNARVSRIFKPQSKQLISFSQKPISNDSVHKKVLCLRALNWKGKVKPGNNTRLHVSSDWHPDQRCYWQTAPVCHDSAGLPAANQIWPSVRRVSHS